MGSISLDEMSPARREFGNPELSLSRGGIFWYQLLTYAGSTGIGGRVEMREFSPASLASNKQ